MKEAGTTTAYNHTTKSSCKLWDPSGIANNFVQYWSLVEAAAAVIAANRIQAAVDIAQADRTVADCNIVDAQPRLVRVG